ncbi:MAG: hypothetical protein C0478_05540 [Planctomyces sp.]|nr:hypothetical protein [Planctomyces sp.]
MRRECPYCAEYVSAAATVCPHCETEIGNRSMAAASPGRSRSEDSASDAPPRRKSKAVWIIVPLVLLVMLVPCGGIGIALLLPAVQQARMAAQRTQTRNNMKQIGLAMHNFHDTYNHFPPRLNDVEREMQEEVLQSWMTDLGPFSGSGQSPIWSAIDRKLPFDDPANQFPFSQRISEYQSPLLPEQSTAIYGPAHFALNVHLWNPEKPIGIREITDGTSNTIMAGSIPSADTAAAWGDPDNLRDTADGINQDPYGFGSPIPNQAQFLMSDGTVHVISDHIDRTLLKNLGTPADGEMVGDF